MIIGDFGKTLDREETKIKMKALSYQGLFDCSERALENALEIMSARNKRSTAHAPRSQRMSTRSQRMSTRSLPKSRMPNPTGFMLSSGSE